MVLSKSDEIEILMLKQEFKREDHKNGLEFLRLEHQYKAQRLHWLLEIAKAGGIKTLDSLDK